MTRILLVCAIVLITGCGKPLTNPEIIKAVKECGDAGMGVLIGSNFDGEIFQVSCDPYLKPGNAR